MRRKAFAIGGSTPDISKSIFHLSERVTVIFSPFENASSSKELSRPRQFQNSRLFLQNFARRSPTQPVTSIVKIFRQIQQDLTGMVFWSSRLLSSYSWARIRKPRKICFWKFCHLFKNGRVVFYFKNRGTADSSQRTRLRSWRGRYSSGPLS